MKKALVLLLALALGASASVQSARAAQEIELPSVYARLRFPDPWLVLTPASLPVYASILREAGMNPDDMATRYANQGVVAEGWSETFDDSYRLIVQEDERSLALFDLERSVGAQRKAISNSFLGDHERTLPGIHYVDANWDKSEALGWTLLLRYSLTDEKDVTTQGVQIFTIRFGKSYLLDWAVGARRVTNRDLAHLRELYGGLTFIGGTDAPQPTVRLAIDGDPPKESGKPDLQLEGTTEPGAGLTLSRKKPSGESEPLSVGSADRQGVFLLNATLENPGEYDLTLTAEKEGCKTTSLAWKLTYQKGMIPLNIENLPGKEYTQDTYTLVGSALPGASLQIVTGKKSLTRHVGTDGRFSVEIDTSAPGEYSVLIIATKKGMPERRIAVDFTRVASVQEDRDALKQDAVRLTYAQLMRDPESHVGSLVTFSGVVTEVSHGTSVWFVRLDVSRSSGNSWPMVLSCETDPQLTKGERISFYGTANFPFIEQDAKGNEIRVPSITLSWLEK